MNKTLGIVIAVIVILGGAYLIMRSPDRSDTTVNVNETGTAGETQGVNSEGRVVFSVTDAAANMSAISEINMKVNTVEVHSATQGWATVSSTPKTYSLLMLNSKSESELLADADIKSGTYDQVRLGVSAVAVIMKDGSTKDAKLPSGELKMNTKLVVNNDSTSSINFDFLADKSLHTTGSGKYIFAPVVKIESKSNADVSVDSNNVVEASGGKTDDSSTVGMDIDGSVKANFQIDSKAKLDLDANNNIKLNGVLD